MDEFEAVEKRMNVAFMFEADGLIAHPRQGWFLIAGSDLCLKQGVVLTSRDYADIIEF